MSLHKERTKQEVEGLLKHGLAVGKPCQLSDAFVLGMRFEQSLSTNEVKRETIEGLLAQHEKDREKVSSQCNTLINMSTVDKYLRSLG